MRLRAFAGVAGGDGEEGISTIGDDEEAAAMACVARAIVITADNLYVGVGSHTPLSGRMARLGPRADQGLDRSGTFWSVQVLSQGRVRNGVAETFFIRLE